MLTDLYDDALVEQRILLGSHDEVVGLIFVVDDVLQVDAGGDVQIFKEFLIENESHSADLLDARLRLALTVHQIRRDGNRQSTPELFPLKS